MAKKNCILIVFCSLLFILNGCGANNQTENHNNLSNNSNNNNLFNYLGDNIEDANDENNIDTDQDYFDSRITEYARNTPYTIPETVERNEETENVRSDYNTKRASRIASTITRFPEVEKSTVVITGNTALVGINLLDNMSNEQIDQIKLKIEKKVEAMDGELKNVSVTASPELVDRIFTIAQDIGQGRPITGLADELGSILRRVTPTI